MAFSSKGTSQSQQSLQLKHFSQRWLRQVSLVQLTQMRVDSSSQMLHENGISLPFYLGVEERVPRRGASRVRLPRQRWASLSTN